MNLKTTAAILGITIGIMSMTACGTVQDTSNQNAQAKNVKVITAQKSSLVIENEFAGDIKANEEAGVISKTPGKVKEVLVKVGDNVKEGDILFTLDSDDVKAQRNQALSGADVTKASLDRTLLQLQAEYDAAKLNLEDENTNYQRIKTLFDNGGLSKKDLEAAQTRLDSATQRMDNARKNLELFNSGISSAGLAQSQLEQSNASVQLMDAQLGNMTVRAPISGIIAAKNINVGEGVSAGAPAIVITNTTELNAEMNIPEKLVGKFYKGQKLSVVVESLDNKVINGEVSLIYPSIDTVTKTCRVKVKLLESSDGIKPGMYAKIKMAVEKKDDTLTIPNNAVFTENGIQYVYVVRDNKVSKTPIKVGLSNDKVVEITQGLNVDDKLIIEGQSFLSDGETIKVLVKSL